jgi:RNA polymerase sigma factor (sigma-70 family)
VGKAVLAETCHDVGVAGGNGSGRRAAGWPFCGVRVEGGQFDHRGEAETMRGAANDAAALAIEYMPLARARARWATRRYRQDYGEAFSDAFFGLAKALRRGRPGSTFSAYASTTIEGAILRGIRDRSGLRAQYERGGDPPPCVVALNAQTMADGGPSPAEQVLRRELWREVDRLPGRQPIAVRLSYQYGMYQAEIPHLMGVAQMTVSRDLARAPRGTRAGRPASPSSCSRPTPPSASPHQNRTSPTGHHSLATEAAPARRRVI